MDAMPADFNDDQRVNVVDRARVALAIKLFNAGTYTQRADLNADGAVNVIDRTIVVFYIRLTAGAACAP